MPDKDQTHGASGHGESGRPRTQHYVPQFLLRRFTDAHGSLGVFDKQSDRVFNTGTRAVAAENYFYDVEVGQDIVTLEPGLAKLEGAAAAVVDQICEEDSLAGLSSEQRACLATLIGVQAIRTRFLRDNIVNMSRQLADRMADDLPAPRSQAARALQTSDEDAKRISMSLIPKAGEQVAMIVAQKPWILARAPNDDLYVGDNPVTMHNERDLGFYGNIGFAVPGVEICFPLSARYTIYIPCPSTVEPARENLAILDGLSRGERRKAIGLERRLEPARRFIGAIDDGRPLELERRHVEYMNSLQVSYAGRWVFGRPGDFELARRMVTENERYRTGPFGQVS